MLEVDAMILVITKLKERFGSDQVGLIGALKQMGLGSCTGISFGNE